MRLALAPLALIALAGSAAAGSLSPGYGSALTLTCTDNATATFPATFSGAGCSVEGVAGQTGSQGSVRLCRIGGEGGEVLSVSPDLTFSMINLTTRGVLDGSCSRT